MRLFPDTKVYVTCPGNAHTGGPELLHQLCSTLIQYGIDAYMFYTFGNAENPVDDFYFKYHVPYLLEVEDNPHNVVIFSEAIGEHYFKFNSAQKIFWWLSVDGLVINIISILEFFSGNFLRKPLPKFFYFQDTEKNIDHWVQSEYARQFVLLNGVHEKNIYVVEDYLSQAFLSKAATVDLNQKEDVVVFNPAKGFHVTQRLIELAPNFKWIPIQNMTPEQVQFVLSKAKVYIDFGHHPGKDRIPREAAISGCVVITGKRGAAANDVDINIPHEFKFGETEEDFPKIIEKILDTFQNFEKAHDKQSDYRERILDDKNRFKNEVAEAFNLKSTAKINAAALWQGYDDKSYRLLEILSQDDYSFVPKFIVDNRLGNNKPAAGELIKHRDNCNFFVTDSADDGRRYELPFISEDDAKFLYLEGRIKKFLLLAPDEEEIISLIKKVNPDEEDVLILSTD